MGQAVRCFNGTPQSMAHRICSRRIAMNVRPWHVWVVFCALPAAAADCPSLLNHQYKTLQGGNVNLCEFAGRPILVVNTASKCGYTPQFEKLEALYRATRTRPGGAGVSVERLQPGAGDEPGDRPVLQAHLLRRVPMIEKGSVTGPAPMLCQAACACDGQRRPSGTSTSTSSRPTARPSTALPRRSNRIPPRS